MYGNKYICEYCGAYNDPDEHCECQSKRDTAIRKRHAKNEIIRKIIQMPVRKTGSIIMQNIQNRLQKRIHITIILSKTQALQPEEIIRNTTTRILITPIKAM